MPPIPTPPFIGRHPQPPAPSFASQAATFSIAAPLVAMAISIFLQSAVKGNRIAMVIIGGTSIFLILSGFVLGLIALVQTKKHGKQGIFGKALAGVCVNGVLIALMLITIPALIKAVDRAKEEQRQQQPR